MHMKWVKRGDHLIIPIAGWRVTEIRLRTFALPSLVFHLPDQLEATLDLEAVLVTIQGAGWERSVSWEKSKPYNASDLTPFLKMLGRTVK